MFLLPLCLADDVKDFPEGDIVFEELVAFVLFALSVTPAIGLSLSITTVDADHGEFNGDEESEETDDGSDIDDADGEDERDDVNDINDDAGDDGDRLQCDDSSDGLDNRVILLAPDVLWSLCEDSLSKVMPFIAGLSSVPVLLTGLLRQDQFC